MMSLKQDVDVMLLLSDGWQHLDDGGHCAGCEQSCQLLWWWAYVERCRNTPTCCRE